MVKTREIKKPRKPFGDEEEVVRKSPRASSKATLVKKPALKGTSKKVIVKRDKPVTVMTSKGKKKAKSKSKSKRSKRKGKTGKKAKAEILPKEEEAEEEEEQEVVAEQEKQKNLKIVFDTRGSSVRIARLKGKKERERRLQEQIERRSPKIKKERKHYSSTDAKRSGLNRESREDSPTRGMSEIDRIKAALDDIANGREKNAARAAYKWRVHSDKLYRRLKGEVKPDHRNGPPPVLSRAEEDKLATWMQTMSSRGFYVSSGSLRNTVQNFLKQDKRKNPFTDDKPSMSWHKAFMSRNPKVKEPSNMMTLIRSGKSREVIDGWFDELESFLTALGLMDRPDRIYHFQEVDFNMTGSTTGPFADISQDFKEGSISICGISANAAGTMVPPYFLFKGHGIPSTWNPLSGAPEKSGMYFSPKGTMTKLAYSDWLENHFLYHIGEERPVALLLDCPDGHIDVDAFVTAQQNGIHFFRVLANVKHRVRPLNKRTFNVAWRQELARWTKNHRFVPVTYKNVARLIGRLWPKVSETEKIKESFRRAGIYPLDRDAIDEADPELENQQVASWTYVKPEGEASESDTDDDGEGGDQDGDENELAPLLLAKFEMSMDEETKELYRKRLMENWDHPGARHYQTWKELYEDAYGKIVPQSDVPMAHEEVTVGYEEQVQGQVQEVIMDMVNGSQNEIQVNNSSNVLNVGNTPMNIEIIEVGPSGNGEFKKIIRIPASAQMPTGEYRREGFEENGLSLIAEGIEISQFKLLDQGNDGASTSNVQESTSTSNIGDIQGQVIAVGTEQMVTDASGGVSVISDPNAQVVTVLNDDGSSVPSSVGSEVVLVDGQISEPIVETVVTTSSDIQVPSMISVGDASPNQMVTIDGIQIPVVNPSEVQQTVIAQEGVSNPESSSAGKEESVIKTPIVADVAESVQTENKSAEDLPVMDVVVESGGDDKTAKQQDSTMEIVSEIVGQDSVGSGVIGQSTISSVGSVIISHDSVISEAPPENMIAMDEGSSEVVEGEVISTEVVERVEVPPEQLMKDEELEVKIEGSESEAKVSGNDSSSEKQTSRQRETAVEGGLVHEVITGSSSEVISSEVVESEVISTEVVERVEVPPEQLMKDEELEVKIGGSESEVKVDSNDSLSEKQTSSQKETAIEGGMVPEDSMISEESTGPECQSNEEVMDTGEGSSGGAILAVGPDGQLLSSENGNGDDVSGTEYIVNVIMEHDEDVTSSK